MSFTTTILTSFDEDLFETCYQSESQIIDNYFFTTHPANLSSITTLEEKKAYIKNLFIKYHAIDRYVLYKITNNETGQSVGYECSKKEEANDILMIVSSLYKSSLNNDSWVLNYISENLLNSENSIATQLGFSKWSLPVFDPSLEQFYLTTELKRWVSNGSVNRQLKNNNGNYVVFLSPWGWPNEYIEP
jgi:hypothetical protein